MTDTTPPGPGDEVLFRASWSLWRDLRVMAAISLTVLALLIRTPLSFVVAFSWWLFALWQSVLVAEVTDRTLVLRTALGTRHIAIADITNIGDFYGTVWLRRRLVPWRFQRGRDRSALFYNLNKLRGSSTGTP